LIDEKLLIDTTGSLMRNIVWNGLHFMDEANTSAVGTGKKVGRTRNLLMSFLEKVVQLIITKINSKSPLTYLLPYRPVPVDLGLTSPSVSAPSSSSTSASQTQNIGTSASGGNSTLLPLFVDISWSALPLIIQKRLHQINGNNINNNRGGSYMSPRLRTCRRSNPAGSMKALHDDLLGKKEKGIEDGDWDGRTGAQFEEDAHGMAMDIFLFLFSYFYLLCIKSVLFSNM
jgi:hypothetical protein